MGIDRTLTTRVSFTSAVFSGGFLLTNGDASALCETSLVDGASSTGGFLSSVEVTSVL